MIKKLFLLLFIFIMATPFSVARAATACGADNPNGCSANFYCLAATNPVTQETTYDCASCSKQTNGKYPNSAAGSTDITACYRECQAEDIGDSVEAASGKIYKPSGDAAEDKSHCEVVSCKTSGGTCNMGFHRDGNQCVSNVNSCTNGYKFYINGNMTGCLVTSCSDGNVLVSINGAICNNAPYGECKPQSQPCASQPELNGKCSGTIGGNAARQTNGTLNYSGCTCTTTTSIDNGQQNQKCNFDQSGTSPAQNCTTTLSCNAGFCSTDNTTCAQAAEGFYSPNNDGTCHQCPTGATSTAGSTQKSNCYYHSGTRFTDNTGSSFTLPVGSNHINVVNQNN